jgi:hypothetical protein
VFFQIKKQVQDRKALGVLIIFEHSSFDLATLNFIKAIEVFSLRKKTIIHLETLFLFMSHPLPDIFGAEHKVLSVMIGISQ